MKLIDTMFALFVSIDGIRDLGCEELMGTVNDSGFISFAGATYLERYVCVVSFSYVLISIEST